jgi:hypothetical protein
VSADNTSEARSALEHLVRVGARATPEVLGEVVGAAEMLRDVEEILAADPQSPHSLALADLLGLTSGLRGAGIRTRKSAASRHLRQRRPVTRDRGENPPLVGRQQARALEAHFESVLHDVLRLRALREAPEIVHELVAVLPPLQTVLLELHVLREDRGMTVPRLRLYAKALCALPAVIAELERSALDPGDSHVAVLQTIDCAVRHEITRPDHAILLETELNLGKSRKSYSRRRDYLRQFLGLSEDEYFELSDQAYEALCLCLLSLRSSPCPADVDQPVVRHLPTDVRISVDGLTGVDGLERLIGLLQSAADEARRTQIAHMIMDHLPRARALFEKSPGLPVEMPGLDPDKPVFRTDPWNARRMVRHVLHAAIRQEYGRDLVGDEPGIIPVDVLVRSLIFGRSSEPSVWYASVERLVVGIRSIEARDGWRDAGALTQPVRSVTIDPSGELLWDSGDELPTEVGSNRWPEDDGLDARD